MVYSNCQCSSAFCWSLTHCSFYLACGHLLGKCCPLPSHLAFHLGDINIKHALAYLKYFKIFSTGTPQVAPFATTGQKGGGKSDEKWAASSEFGTYRLCEQRRSRRACASAQSLQNLRCSLIAVSQEEPSDRKPDPWPLWMAGHEQLKFVMAECSKTQIRLTRPKCMWILWQ